MNKCTNAVVITAAAYIGSRLPRLHPSHQQLSLCFGTMRLYYVWSRHLTSVQEEQEEIDVCDYVVLCWCDGSLHGGGEKASDGSSQQEQQ